MCLEDQNRQSNAKSLQRSKLLNWQCKDFALLKIICSSFRVFWLFMIRKPIHILMQVLSLITFLVIAKHFWGGALSYQLFWILVTLSTKTHQWCQSSTATWAGWTSKQITLIQNLSNLSSPTFSHLSVELSQGSEFSWRSWPVGWRNNPSKGFYFLSFLFFNLKC